MCRIGATTGLIYIYRTPSLLGDGIAKCSAFLGDLPIPLIKKYGCARLASYDLITWCIIFRFCCHSSHYK